MNISGRASGRRQVIDGLELLIKEEPRFIQDTMEKPNLLNFSGKFSYNGGQVN